MNVREKMVGLLKEAPYNIFDNKLGGMLFDSCLGMIADHLITNGVTVQERIEDHDYIKCPKCGVMVKRDFTFFDVGDWNFCPNCGEPMEGGAENADD